MGRPVSDVDDAIERAEDRDDQLIYTDWVVLADEVRRLREQVSAVEALTGGPFSDGYRPYAMNIDGEVILAVGLDDIRAALASGGEVQP